MKPFVTMLALLYILSAVHCIKGPITTGNDHPGPEHALPVSSANIDEHLSTAGGAAIIEFYSEYCQVCASLTWVIDSLYIALGDSVFVGANNTDTDTLWKRYSATTVPTYILFYEGAEVTRLSFAENEPQVFDSLAALTRQLIAGTLVPDTGDTGTPRDTVPANYLTLDESTFDTTVLRYGVTAMVFFLYAGGKPCIQMDSVVRHMAPPFKGRAVIAKVHAWEQSALSDRYGIDHVPQFLFFKNGILRQDAHREGIVSEDTLIALLERLLAGNVLSLDNNNFSDSISVEGRITMVEFFSPTCGACRSVANVVEALADTFALTAVIAQVNVLENSSLVKAFDIEGWPTFIFFRGGIEYNRILGGSSDSFNELAAIIQTGIDGPVAKKTAGFLP